jgi:hypothetical protein
MSIAAHWRSFCPATGLLKHFTALLGILMFILTTSGTAWARHGGGVVITSAAWSGKQGGTLTVKGSAEQIGPAGPVLLFDADTQVQIGQDDSVSSNHKFDIQTSTAACFVYAVQDGLSTLETQGPFPVSGNPPLNCDVGNTPPVANVDNDNVDVNMSVTIDVVANDTDVEDGSPPPVPPASVTIDTQPTKGTVQNNLDGTVTYTNTDGTPGPDSFTYTLTDSGGLSDSATVNITVIGAGNNPPVANDDAGNVDVNMSVTINVVANDSDVEDGTPPPVPPASITIGTQPSNGTAVENGDGTVTYTNNGIQGLDSFTYTLTDSGGASDSATVTITVIGLTARGDSYTTPRNRTLDVVATRLSGVLYNDFDANGDSLVAAHLVSNPSNGNVTLNSDGSFSYTPSKDFQGDDQFTYQGEDSNGELTDVATVNVRVLPDQPDFKFMMNYELGMHCTGFEFAYCCVLPAYNSIVAQVAKRDNGLDWPHLLEGDPNLGRNLDVLGRETVVRSPELDGSNGFQKYVIKYWHDAQSRNDGQGKPQDPGTTIPGLPGYLNSSTLISDAEAHTLLAWNTRADAAAEDSNNKLILGSDPAGAATDVVQGDGDYGTIGNTFQVPIDNYQNAVWNHLYIYADTEGTRLCVDDTSVACHENADCDSEPGADDGVCGDSTEANKVRLGLDVDYPTNFGPGGHPLGPVSGGTFKDNAFLTFSEDTGTVVYTQAKVVENLPIMLTSPRMWEALGLALTPFEDTLGFFANPGLVDEDSIRPYVQMTAQLHEADCASDGSCQAGAVVLDSSGNPVQGFGDAPIDIPNCERCHSAFNDPQLGNAPNSPNDLGTPEAGLVQLEIDYWNAYYDIDVSTGDADWYSRLKGAAISILSTHDVDHGTGFTDAYPAVQPIQAASDPFDPVNELGGLFDPFYNSPARCLIDKEPVGNTCTAHTDCPTDGPNATDGVCDVPQNTRLGYESVICQKCHADNVIAVVKSATCGPNGTGRDAQGTIVPCTGNTIPALSQALHWNHRSIAAGGPIDFDDALFRDGSCQGCHPAHRSDGVMDGYPITKDGNNFYETGDNRLASGGCFVGRDVHSNPRKDVDGAETPEYLTAVGQYLKDNVGRNQAGEPGGTEDFRGIWCTNCHTQLAQEMWRAENVYDLVNGDGVCVDATGNNQGQTCKADGDCGAGEICALINVRAIPTLGGLATALGTNVDQVISWLDPKTNRAVDDSYRIWDPDQTDSNVATIEVNNGVPQGSTDPDGDFTVRILDFCTTDDCVRAAQATLDGEGNESDAVAVPFSAATDGREHWLSPGEPHCADCHTAPFTEQSGNINAFPPFNYPRKASLMRYSRGHKDLTCQSCHESIHGLYPVTPTIDNTSYAQAASLNDDGSHGPLKCGACHQVDGDGVPTWVEDGLKFNGQPVKGDYDVAVQWAHSATAEYDELQEDGTCNNCHVWNNYPEPNENYVPANVNWDNRAWTEHSFKARVPRHSMDQVEAQLGTDQSDPLNTLCKSCHGDRSNTLSRKGCTDKWRNHLIEGRASESVWEEVSLLTVSDQPASDGTICGW